MTAERMIDATTAELLDLYDLSEATARAALARGATEAEALELGADAAIALAKERGWL